MYCRYKKTKEDMPLIAANHWCFCPFRAHTPPAQIPRAVPWAKSLRAFQAVGSLAASRGNKCSLAREQVQPREEVKACFAERERPFHSQQKAVSQKATIIFFRF